MVRSFVTNDWALDLSLRCYRLIVESHVRRWITINEPLTIVENGYASTANAPGRCSDRSVCWAGDNLHEPYVVAKNLILAHARAFRAWKAAGSPGLGCGITLNGDWREPMNPASAADRAAAVRSLEWQAPLFADPSRRRALLYDPCQI